MCTVLIRAERCEQRIKDPSQFSPHLVPGPSIAARIDRTLARRGMASHGNGKEPLKQPTLQGSPGSGRLQLGPVTEASTVVNNGKTVKAGPHWRSLPHHPTLADLEPAFHAAAEPTADEQGEEEPGEEEAGEEDDGEEQFAKE